MFVSAVGKLPVLPTAAIRRVDRSTPEPLETPEVQSADHENELVITRDRQGKRRKAPVTPSRSAAERSSPAVLEALAQLKLGG